MTTDTEAQNSGDAVLNAAKRALVNSSSRVLFYPTLLYALLRNRLEAEFHWWDAIDKHVILGAVPFPEDIARLKELGVHAVVTLNEPHETLVSSAEYKASGINHLEVPTTDFMYAPSSEDLKRAVAFIHEHEQKGLGTYVHCKAGRARSTTVVLCYLVQHKDMRPLEALEFVRIRRPRISLAQSQWEAVLHFEQQLLADSPPAYLATPPSELEMMLPPQQASVEEASGSEEEDGFVIVSAQATWPEDLSASTRGSWSRALSSVLQSLHSLRQSGREKLLCACLARVLRAQDCGAAVRMEEVAHGEDLSGTRLVAL